MRQAMTTCHHPVYILGRFGLGRGHFGTVDTTMLHRSVQEPWNGYMSGRHLDHLFISIRVPIVRYQMQMTNTGVLRLLLLDMARSRWAEPLPLKGRAFDQMRRNGCV
jgi:hypothetical protein